MIRYYGNFIKSFLNFNIFKPSSVKFLTNGHYLNKCLEGSLDTHLPQKYDLISKLLVQNHRFDQFVCSALDDLRREQFNKIVGKIGIKKKDAGMYWKQYKTKRMKIKKRKRVI